MNIKNPFIVEFVQRHFAVVLMFILIVFILQRPNQEKVVFFSVSENGVRRIDQFLEEDNKMMKLSFIEHFNKYYYNFQHESLTDQVRNKVINYFDEDFWAKKERASFENGRKYIMKNQVKQVSKILRKAIDSDNPNKLGFIVEVKEFNKFRGAPITAKKLVEMVIREGKPVSSKEPYGFYIQELSERDI